jgi:broad specificity phosphatase PhoE
VRRLLLVRHGSTTATRASAFPADEALDERGRAAAGALAGAFDDHAGDVLSSPSRRCLETVSAARLREPAVDSALAECDFGAWASRTLADVHADDDVAVAAWMTDPDAAPHGGESLSRFMRRVGGWLDHQGTLAGRAVAVTHGGVVKAAVVHSLAAPPAAFWRIDVAPLSITELHCHDGRWTVVRINCASAPMAGIAA